MDRPHQHGGVAIDDTHDVVGAVWVDNANKVIAENNCSVTLRR